MTLPRSRAKGRKCHAATALVLGFLSVVLISTSKTVRASAAANESMTPVDVAAALAVSPSSVRRWIADGRLEGVLVGGRYRVEQQALERMVQPAGPVELAP